MLCLAAFFQRAPLTAAGAERILPTQKDRGKKKRKCHTLIHLYNAEMQPSKLTFLNSEVGP